MLTRKLSPLSFLVNYMAQPVLARLQRVLEDARTDVNTSEPMLLVAGACDALPRICATRGRKAVRPGVASDIGSQRPRAFGGVGPGGAEPLSVPPQPRAAKPGDTGGSAGSPARDRAVPP